jgi:hypothetical protein
MNHARKYALTMSLYTNSRGFAFVLFEGTLSPYDWRVLEVRGPKKDEQRLEKITAILDRSEPDVLILQDTGPGGTPRSLRLVSPRRASRYDPLAGAASAACSTRPRSHNPTLCPTIRSAALFMVAAAARRQGTSP